MYNLLLASLSSNTAKPSSIHKSAFEALAEAEYEMGLHILTSQKISQPPET